MGPNVRRLAESQERWDEAVDVWEAAAACEGLVKSPPICVWLSGVRGAGYLDKAVDHLRRILDVDRAHVPALRRLVSLTPETNEQHVVALEALNEVLPMVGKRLRSPASCTRQEPPSLSMILRFRRYTSLLFN